MSSSSFPHYFPIPLRPLEEKEKYIVTRIEGILSSPHLKITATDGVNAFQAEWKKNELKRGKSGNYDGSDEEWLKILFDALYATGDEAVQVIAQLKPGEKITLVIQRTENEEEEEFTVRLGALEIPEDEEAEVDLAAWLTNSALQCIQLQQESRQLKEQISTENETIESLKEALETLTKAKEEYETELLNKVPSLQILLTKFNLLLNEKKAKIRELTNNRPVPGGRIPGETSSEDEGETQKIEPPTKKGKGKGKAAAPAKRALKKTTPPPKKTRATKGKRKRTPTPEPESEPRKEDVEMPDAEDDTEIEEEEQEDSVQGDEDRDADVERTFSLRDDEGDVTEDEEL